jgi:hypothetical protein
MRVQTEPRDRASEPQTRLPEEAGLPEPQRPPRHEVEDTLAWLEREVWTLPQLDPRSAEAILGYGDDGLWS